MKAFTFKSGAYTSLIIGTLMVHLWAAPDPSAPPSTVYVPVLPGIRLSTQDLIGDADIIIATGVLENLGQPSMTGGPGQYSYLGQTYTITKFLRGKCNRAVRLYVQIRY